MRLPTTATYLMVARVALAVSICQAAHCRIRAAESSTGVPQTMFWEGGHLAAVRTGKFRADPLVEQSFVRLRKNAELALQRGPYSVMQKREVAPSGDRHDYLSYARYWWPNPQTPDGLPFVRRDGRTNPDALVKGDRGTIGNMYDDVETLALAGYLWEEPRFSHHAAQLVRSWFLDPATRMNPHLRFGQAIPGLTEGRGSGIIDTRHFIRVLDSVRLLQVTKAWSAKDQADLVSWMKQYLNWLRNDPSAENERRGHNNHGTWCDAQVATIAMFVGERDLAKEIVATARANRIAKRVEPDGAQPEELTRTKSLHYSVFNLSALSVLARIGEQVDVDLWNYSTEDGRSIRRGLDFVLPYLRSEKIWPHEQISKMSVSPSDMGLFYLAAKRYQEPQYLEVLRHTNPHADENEYVQLLFSSN